MVLVYVPLLCIVLLPELHSWLQSACVRTEVPLTIFIKHDPRSTTRCEAYCRVRGVAISLRW
jgi:hypothetical protein